MGEIVPSPRWHPQRCGSAVAGNSSGGRQTDLDRTFEVGRGVHREKPRRDVLSYTLTLFCTEFFCVLCTPSPSRYLENDCLYHPFELSLSGVFPSHVPGVSFERQRRPEYP